MSAQFNMYISDEHRQKLDALRDNHPEKPDRSKMVRILIERAFRETIKAGARHG